MAILNRASVAGVDSLHRKNVPRSGDISTTSVAQWSCLDFMDASISLMFWQEILNGNIEGGLEDAAKGTY